MAIQGPIPVEFGHVFPRGAFAAGGFEPVRDFEASKAGRFVQSKDKASGLPLWVAEVIDGDPQARDKTARVKIAAADQPVLPAAMMYQHATRDRDQVIAQALGVLVREVRPEPAEGPGEQDERRERDA
jgi:hypothetical protein